VVRVAISAGDWPDWLADAVRAGGGELGELARADALLVPAGGAAAAREVERALGEAPGIRWVQVSFTGVERFLHLMGNGRTWTCARGVYGPTVAEHALALALAGLRQLPRFANERTWERPDLRSLFGARVVLVGAGSIGSSLREMLAPFDCRLSVLTSSSTQPLAEAVRDADVVFLAAPLTAQTSGMIGERELRAMGPMAWLVNVARGQLVRTGDLVSALREGWIAGAATDVTDPEPLPPDHPLWDLPNCLITPHVAAVEEVAFKSYARLVTENVRRFAEGRELLGRVDPDRGY
jgi:phosphoglycerate dehydrogenase-like enzyme